MSQLLDMMLKNRLQTELNKEKIEALEYHSLYSKDTATNHFVSADLIDPKKHFSRGAYRNFEMMKEVLIQVKLNPHPDFENEIE